MTRCAPASGQRVEIERQRRHQGLAFAGRHFGDLALVQHDAADQLDVVRHHVPGQLVTGHHDLGAQQPTGRLAHGGEGLGEQIVESRLQLFLVSDFELVVAILELVPLFGIGTVVALLPDLLQLVLDQGNPLGQLAAELWSGPATRPPDKLPSCASWRLMASTIGRIFFDVPVVSGTENRCSEFLKHPSNIIPAPGYTLPPGPATQYRIGWFCATRRRISVAEISSHRNPHHLRSLGDFGQIHPGRAKTTTWARVGISAPSRHWIQLPGCVGPDQKGKALPGSRACSARRVSTV